jgi:hypothetical protein
MVRAPLDGSARDGYNGLEHVIRLGVGGGVEPILARGTMPWPLEEVADLLTHQPSDWLEPFLRIAAHMGDKEGAALASTLGREMGQTGGERNARIVVRGRRVPAGVTSSTISFRWYTDGYHTVFPMLEGRFVLERLPDAQTAVMIEGRLTPPDTLTDPAGRIIARRAAMATSARLLTSLRAALEERSRAEP